MTQAELTAVDAAGPSSVELLDELESLIGEGRRVPFSANVVVNEDEALELIDRARLGLPQEIIEARHTVVDRERIITSAEDESESLLTRSRDEASALVAEARATAERLVEEARRQADLLVSQSEVVKTAHQKAADLLTSAEHEAAAIRAESDAYAGDVMATLEADLSRTLATVRKGLATLPSPEAAKSGRRGKRGGL